MTTNKIAAILITLALSLPHPVHAVQPMLASWQPTDLAHVGNAELIYLDVLSWHVGLPDGTLQVMWAIESHAGERNVCNSSGYCGHFQAGKYERRRYRFGNVFSLSDAANGTVNLLRAYERMSGQEITTITDAYLLHQQGANGAAMINRAMRGEGRLSRRIKRNMKANLPTVQRGLLFDQSGKPRYNDQTTAMNFYYFWDAEINRIKDGLTHAK